MHEASNLGFRSPKFFKNDSSTPSSSSRSFKRKGSLLRFANQQKRQQYHPKNNQYPKNSVYYDSSSPYKDQSMQHSIPTNQSQDSWRQYSQKKSLRQSQYSSSGFHNQRKKYEHQITLLKKQISRLQKEVQSKEKQINSIEENRSQYKQIQMELVETYRVINYYEGKIKEQQKINTYLESILNTQVGNKTKGKLKQGLDFKSIIQFFRNQSIELKGQLQKSNHQNTKITFQLQKLQSKFNQLQKTYRESVRKHTSPKNDYELMHLQSLPQSKKAATIYEARLQSSQNRIASRRADDQSSVTSSVKSYSSNKKFQKLNTLNQSSNQQKNQFAKIYGNFNSKINKIQKQLDFFKIENEKAQNQLIEKIQIIGQLTLQNDELRYLLEDKNQQKDYVDKIQINETQQSQNLIDQFVTSLPQNYLKMKKTSTAQSQKKVTQKIGNNFNKVYQRPVQVGSPSDKRKTQLKNLSLNELSKKLHESQQKPYKFKDIQPDTVRKLRYNLIRQDITHSKLLQTIIEKLTNSEDPNEIVQELEDIPYQLTNNEALTFISEYKKILTYLKEKQLSQSIKNLNQPGKDLTKEENDKILKQKLKQIFKQNIPQFKNITLRKDASLTSQLTKAFKNRLAELDPYLRDKKKGILPFQQAQKLFKQQWHLSDQQIDFILLKSCEESQQYGKFDFNKTIRFFLQN